jgi:hypothetical protein
VRAALKRFEQFVDASCARQITVRVLRIRGPRWLSVRDRKSYEAAHFKEIPLANAWLKVDISR